MDRQTFRERNRLFDDQSKYLDHFGLVLILTAAMIVVLALVDLTPSKPNPLVAVASWAAAVVVAIVLLIALRASGLARRWQRLALVLVVVGLVFALALLIAYLVAPDRLPSTPYSTVPILTVILAVAAPLAIIRRLTCHRRVTRETLIAAVSVYLLIPVAYYYAFLAVNKGGTSFFGTTQPTQSFMYFSLTTVTTTGYGDLTAVTPFGRLLANSEAVMGQLYLVTVVALIVGSMASSWRPGGGRGVPMTESDSEN